MRTLLAVVVAVASWGAGGCNLYFDDDDPCLFGGGDSGYVDGAAEPAVGLRNPQTGQCEFLGGGGGTPPCDDACGPCPVSEPDPAPLPSWGFCESECTGLGESACPATPGCRGAYLVPGELDPGPRFYECWSVDMTGPVQGGGCEGLDAWACSVHDDCIAIHFAGASGEAPVPVGIGDFEACAAEPVGCYSDNDCAAGTRCNAAEVCLPPPDCEPGGACEPVCYGFCVPDGVAPATPAAAPPD
jgi:hypothetical protein